jgi:tetratricopeptide (TPR) repeat protein
MKLRHSMAGLMAVGLLALSGAAHAVVDPIEPPSENAGQFDAAAEYRKGVDAVQAGKFDDAVDIFNGVLEKTPNDANALYFLGVAREGRKDLGGAGSAFEAAVKADPDSVRAWQELGVVQAKMGQTDKAKVTLEELKRLDAACAGTCAKSVDLKTGVAKVQAAIGAGASAKLDAGQKLLFARAGVGDHAYLEAVSLINDHKYAQALDALKASEAAFGPHPDILTYIGFVNRKLGNYDVAEEYYHRALAAAPEHRGATEYYGELKVVRGDMAGAKKLLARLDTLCTYGCAEADELRRWINGEHSGS